MKLWRLSVGDYNTSLDGNDDSEFETPILKGEKALNWQKVIFKAVRKGKYRDFAHYRSGVPVFSEKALEVIGELIAPHVQLLDIEVSNVDVNYKLVNIISVLNAVDYTRSIPTRISSGHVTGFKKLNFLEDVVKDQHIFRIPEFLRTKTYVSDFFREKILASKLKGFEFYEVWDSEWTDELEREQQEKYEAFLTKIEDEKGEEFSWSEAIDKLEKGETVVSGEWKMLYDPSRELIIFKLSLDCEYTRFNSNYVPPILLGLKWHVVSA